MSVVNSKSGVLFTVIAPGGFRILSAIDQTAAKLGVDLVITSACDGLHSGPDDPHHRGCAYDIRSHDFDPDTKDKVLATLMSFLEPDRFFGFIESPGTDNEHFHCQVKKGTVYP
jgi:hypothetical protein